MITALHGKGKGKQGDRGPGAVPAQKIFASVSGGRHNGAMRKAREMAAGLIIREKRALLVHNMKHGLRIEPPGGKKEAHEGWEEAVVREIREELGVEAAIRSFIGEYATHSPEGDFLVRLYLCEIISGEPSVMEPEKIPSFGWYSFDEIKEAARDGALVPNMALALPDIEKFFE